MKHLTNTCVIILLIAQSVFAQVKIPDPQLEVSLREALKLSPGTPITKDAMLRLTVFKAEQREITDLTGLQFATNMTRLFLGGNKISDLTPLSEMRKLRSLSLWENRIDSVLDLSPLSNLTEVTVLDITASRIEDLTPLTNLTELRWLSLGATGIEDISPLANLRKLRFLRLSVNRIGDVSPLANLTQLEELYITRNRIVDFSPLQGLSLIKFQYDQVCVMPGLPLQNRIENRNLHSIIQSWSDKTVNLRHLSFYDRVAYHDLYWDHLPFRFRFQQIPPWSRLVGSLDTAIMERDELLAKNPNMIFLAQMKIDSASDSVYPEDWFGWVRDENGNPVRSDPDLDDHYL